MPSIGAVITGGDYQGLGAVRSLARKGIPVHVVDHELSIGRFSRYVERFSKGPNPNDENRYLEFLIDYATKRKMKGWVLFPNNDQVVKILSQNRAALEPYYRIPTPDWECIKYAFDKRFSYRLAASLGIPIPKTFYPKNRDDLMDSEIVFPVIIKPSVRGIFFEKLQKKAILAVDRPQLLRLYDKICRIIPPSEVLIQEFIQAGPRHLYSFCPFFKDGRVIAKIMARRSRQHPMDFGQATTYAESVRIPEIEELGKKFLDQIGYYGLAEVEFMFDPRDRTYKFLEVNARIWGWHTLAIRSGIDLPFLLYSDMIGKPLELSFPDTDVKWIRCVTDIPTVLGEILKGRMTLNEYVSSLKGEKEHAVFAPDDPLPFFVEILLLPYLFVKRGF